MYVTKYSLHTDLGIQFVKAAWYVTKYSLHTDLGIQFVNAAWYVTKYSFHTDLGIQFVKAEIRLATSFDKHLLRRSDDFMTGLLHKAIAPED